MTESQGLENIRRITENTNTGKSALLSTDES